MRKIIIPIVSFLVVVVTILCAVIFTKKDTIVMNMKKNYDISSTVGENDKLNVNLFITNKKSYFVDQKQLNECYITSNLNGEVMSLSIDKIIDNKKTVEYNGKKFSDFTFKFNIDLNIESKFIWNIKDAILVLKYNSNKIHNIRIGDISYNKIEPNNNPILGFTNVKAVTTMYKDNIYLSGITFGIRNLNSNDITIKNINIINNSISTGKEIVKLDKVPEENDFNLITGYDFTASCKREKDLNEIISSGEVKYFFVPLYYEKMGLINTFPVEFELINDEKTVYEYFYNFVYYEILAENIDSKDITIYKIK